MVKRNANGGMIVEIRTARTIEAYKSGEMRPESTLNTAITKANSPSAA